MSEKDQTMMRDQIYAEMDAVRLAQRGVPPDLQYVAEDAAATAPENGPLLLTTEEVEVMLCFTLCSPLHYGSIEESLCDKLRRLLRQQYRFRAAAAQES